MAATTEKCSDFPKKFAQNHWRIQGGAPGTRAPPRGHVRQKIIIALLGVGAPPGKNPPLKTYVILTEIEEMCFANELELMHAY